MLLRFSFEHGGYPTKRWNTNSTPRCRRAANMSATFGTSIGQNGCAGIYPAMLAIAGTSDGHASWPRLHPTTDCSYRDCFIRYRRCWWRCNVRSSSGTDHHGAKEHHSSDSDFSVYRSSDWHGSYSAKHLRLYMLSGVLTAKKNGSLNTRTIWRWRHSDCIKRSSSMNSQTLIKGTPRECSSVFPEFRLFR